MFIIKVVVARNPVIALNLKKEKNSVGSNSAPFIVLILSQPVAPSQDFKKSLLMEI